MKLYWTSTAPPADGQPARATLSRRPLAQRDPTGPRTPPGVSCCPEPGLSRLDDGVRRGGPLHARMRDVRRVRSHDPCHAARARVQRAGLGHSVRAERALHRRLLLRSLLKVASDPSSRCSSGPAARADCLTNPKEHAFAKWAGACASFRRSRPTANLPRRRRDRGPDSPIRITTPRSSRSPSRAHGFISDDAAARCGEESISSHCDAAGCL